MIRAAIIPIEFDRVLNHWRELAAQHARNHRNVCLSENIVRQGRFYSGMVGLRYTNKKKKHTATIVAEATRSNITRVVFSGSQKDIERDGSLWSEVSRLILDPEAGCVGSNVWDVCLPDINPSSRYGAIAWRLLNDSGLRWPAV